MSLGGVFAPIDARSFAPMLARTARDVDEIPDGWALEVKWDGVRIVASKVDGTRRLAARSGRDYIGRVPELDDLDELVGARSWVLDGELVCLDAKGRPDFRAIMSRLQAPRGAREPDACVHFVAFDLLAADGVDLRPLPWTERRARLGELAEATSVLLVPEPSFETPDTFLESVRARGLEGLVAKRPDATYVSGARPLRSWMKLVARRHAEFVVTGWTPLNRGGADDLERVGALLIAARLGDGTLRDAGKVGSGFNDATRRELAGRLRDPGSTLVVDVAFADWTDEGRLRHPSFRGIRDDLDPSTLTTETD